MKKSEAHIKIISILNKLDEPAHRIEIIERIGKRLRQQNSIQTAKEVHQFMIKTGNKKNIEIYNING